MNLHLRPGLAALALPAAALLLSGCGGGGGTGGGSPAGSAALHGSVLTRDGSTSSLGGIRITDARTGATVFTAADGSFDLGQVPVGTITLRVFDPAVGTSALALVSAQDDDGGDDSGGVSGGGTGSTDDDETDDDVGDDADDDLDDDGDDNDVGDDDCDVEDIDDGEEVEVHLGIRDGTIEWVEFSCTEDDEREAEVRLTRAETSDDADVEGEAEIETDDDGDELKVEAEHATPGRVLELFVIAPDGTEESQGTATVNAEGEAEWEMDESDGDALPFGLASVADLEGYDVEVRDATAGTLLLFGTLPAVPTSTVDDDDDGEDDETESRGRARLAAEAGVAGEAEVEIRSRAGDESREELKVEIEGQTPGFVAEAFLEDPASPGTMVSVGTFTVGGEGEGELEIDTHDGDALPFGATSVSALVGLRIEVRDAATDALLFSGTVPPLVSEQEDDD